VIHYKQHWWRCSGPCKERAPYYGWVKRAVNRKPGPYDYWWKQHQVDCGGNFLTKFKKLFIKVIISK